MRVSAISSPPACHKPSASSITSPFSVNFTDDASVRIDGSLAATAARYASSAAVKQARSQPSGWLIIGVPAGSIAAGGAAGGWAGGAAEAPAVAGAIGGIAACPALAALAAALAGAPATGAPEFSDFQRPACHPFAGERRAADGTPPQRGGRSNQGSDR
jgi:hypothetical protein